MEDNKIHKLKLGNEREISFVMKKDKHLIKSKGLLMPVRLFVQRYDYLSNLFPLSFYDWRDSFCKNDKK